MGSISSILLWPFDKVLNPPKAGGSVFVPVSSQAAATTPVSPTSSEAKEAAAEAAKKQRIASRLAQGRATTLLSGGQGVAGAAPVKLKQALGE